MLVIADTSPLIVLVNINYIDLLPKLFGEIIIPPAVASELAADSRSQTIRDFAAAPPAWLTVHRPSKVREIRGLHRGENEALSLALELHPDLILIDERRAYKEAISLNLNAIGTVRVLELAASNGLIDLEVAFAQLKQTDFWISHQLLDERLNLFKKAPRNDQK